MNLKNKKVVFPAAVVLVLALLAGLRLAGVSATDKTPDLDAIDKKKVPVVCAQVESRRFEETIGTQGNVQAKNFALVSPRVPGVLVDVFVSEGDEVRAGETRLFRIDSLKLEKALEIAKQNLKVAECSLEERKANAEETEAELHKAMLDYGRYGKLLSSNIVSRVEFEEKEKEFKKFQARKKHAQSLIDLAVEEAAKAAMAKEMAEKDLHDSLMLAPINGKVSQRLAEPGEMGAPGSPVIRVDDTKALEISAFLPASYYQRILPGKTLARIHSNDVRLGEYPIGYKSPTIDPTLRTFEIKVAIEGDGLYLVPGALVDADVILSQVEGLGIPVQALQTRGEGRVCFTAQGDAAVMVKVEPGLETDGWIEVGQSPLSPGDLVVVEGQFLLDDGKPIQVRKGQE